MPLGLQGGFGAGGAVDAATQLRILMQRELEAEARQQAEAARLAEDTRQFDVGTAQRGSQFDKGLAHDVNMLDLRNAFTSTENALGRGHQTSEREAGQLFNAGESQLDRVFRTGEREAGQQFQTSERLGSQSFTTGRDASGQRHDLNLANLGGQQRIAQIVASGVQDRQTAGARAAATAANSAAMKSVLSGVANSIQRLKTGGGRGGAVGMPGLSSLFGLKEAPIAGTAAADYVRYIDTLKSQLTLPNLEVMKGLGPMSEKEFQTVKDATTALDRSMSEAEFMRELGRIESSLGPVMQKFGIAGVEAAPSSGVQFRFNPATGKIEPVK